MFCKNLDLACSSWSLRRTARCSRSFLEASFARVCASQRCCAASVARRLASTFYRFRVVLRFLEVRSGLFPREVSSTRDLWTVESSNFLKHFVVRLSRRLKDGLHPLFPCSSTLKNLRGIFKQSAGAVPGDLLSSEPYRLVGGARRLAQTRVLRGAFLELGCEVCLFCLENSALGIRSLRAVVQSARDRGRRELLVGHARGSQLADRETPRNLRVCVSNSQTCVFVLDESRWNESLELEYKVSDIWETIGSSLSKRAARGPWSF